MAAALLAAGYRAPRYTAVAGAPRGPYCMRGACYEWQVEIDARRWIHFLRRYSGDPLKA